jgi:hypothetical protein
VLGFLKHARRETQQCDGSGIQQKQHSNSALAHAYIAAVQCLGKKPARTPAAIAAGAKSRYDDFVVTHVQQTMTIHFTVGIVLMMWCSKPDAHRATSFPGIVILYGPTNKHSATSVDTKAPTHTTTGLNTPTQEIRPSSTTARLLYPETERSSQDATTPVYPMQTPASYVSSPPTAEDVLPKAPSKTGRST